MPRRSFFRRLGFAIAFAIGASALVSPPPTAQTEGSAVVLAQVDGPIGPATTQFLTRAIDEAAKRGAPALILQINTPGGLLSSTRDIASAILDAPVPVVGYVAPSGSRAASAGTFILYATHIAAMAPATNLGAATPVRMGGGGQDSEEGGGGSDLKKKQLNDAVAFIRSLAQTRGRNADWAEKAVREAATLTAEGAVAENVADLVAADVSVLIAAIDGRRVEIGGGERVLDTAGRAVERLEPKVTTRILEILANPNVAFILMLIGIYGLIFEFANPGSIGPGVIGAISLILGLYALNQLPLDYAGLGLILLGVAFMAAEAFTPTFGVLGVGGLAAFVFGAAILIDTDSPQFQLRWSTIAASAALSGGLLVFLLGYIWRAHRRPVAAGREHMVGETAEVLDWSGAQGHVWADGERWNARGADDLKKGDTVRVRSLEGLTLVVDDTHSQGDSP